MLRIDLDRSCARRSWKSGRDGETAFSTDQRNVTQLLGLAMSLARFPALTEMESTLLIHFIEFADRHGLTRVDAVNIHTNTKEFGVRPLMLKANFTKLCDKSLLILIREDEGSYYEVNPHRADEVDAYFNFITSKQTKQVPASDRFVSIDHNSPDVQEAIEDLNKIEDRVDQSNELELDAEQRKAIKDEVSGIRSLLAGSTVRIASIFAAISAPGILMWLAEHASDAMLNSLASQTISILSKIFGFCT